MIKNITSNFENYRQCLKSIWIDFVKRFDTYQDWDLCDLFADISCSIFDFYIADKFDIPKGKKAKQYQSHRFPIKEIVIKPRCGTYGYRSNSAVNDIWEEMYTILPVNISFG